MIGLLNGSDRYMLNGTWVHIAQVIEPSIGTKWGIVLEKMRDDAPRLWSVAIDDLGPDPTSGSVDSSTSDYKCLFWKKARLFVVAGYSKFVVLDSDSGVSHRQEELRFVDKGSLDVLQFVMSPNEDVLVVVSSLLVVAIDSTSSLRWKWEPQNLIEGVGGVGPAGFTVRRYNFETDATSLIAEYLHY